MRYLFFILLSVNISVANAEGNETFSSFNKAKKTMYKMYNKIPKKTIYCQADFKNRKITNLNGFIFNKYKKRSKRTEAEHIMPAENFGRTFFEWKSGHPLCVTKNGKTFRGRNCASKTNMEYRLMQSDIYNLFPAIGSLNAYRSNFRYVADSGGEKFGACSMTINKRDRTATPPDNAKGVVARTYLYMAETYSRIKLSPSQNNLYRAWSNQYPVTQGECYRGKTIERIQGNVNYILKRACGY